MKRFIYMQEERGFTLIELMVTVVIVGFLFAGIMVLFAKQTETAVANQEDSELRANVQAVANIIKQDIIMAGFGMGGQQYFTHVDGGAGQPDELTLFTFGRSGMGVSTFVVAGGTVSGGDSGNPIPLRCWGEDDMGQRVDPVRDAVFDNNRPLTLIFVSALDGLPLQGIGANPVTVTASNPAMGGNCQAGIDVSNNNEDDPVIFVETASNLQMIPPGTSVYGARGGTSVQYRVADVGGIPTLLQDGTPLMVGVADFQVQFLVNPEGAAAAWVDTLTDVEQTTIEQVRFGLVVRSQRQDPFFEPIGQDIEIPTLPGQVFTVEAGTPAEQFFHRHFQFSVRPRNNAL